MATKVFGFLAAATLATVVSSFAGAANAASLYRSATTNYDTTDLEEQISIQKFNSSLGTLRGITIGFTGDMLGDASFENRSNRSTNVTVNLAGIFGLQLNEQSLFTLNPLQANTYQVTSFDGNEDNRGTSGKTINGLTATQSSTRTFTDSQFLQSFIGTGNVNFLFSAIANSTVRGSGNIASGVNTLARANVSVTYDYDPAKIPEPSAAIGIGVIGGIALLSKSKKKLVRNS